jgi:hypothetical protein
MQNLENTDRGGQSDLGEYLTEVEVTTLRDTHWDILVHALPRALSEEYPLRLRRDRIRDELNWVVRNNNSIARYWLHAAINHRAWQHWPWDVRGLGP